MRKRQFTPDEEALSQHCVRFLGFSTVDTSLQLVVEYPDSFPSKPPRVFTPEDRALLRRHHRAKTREICIFGRNQRRWSARLYGAATIDEADRVIRDMSPASAPEPSGRVAGQDELVDDVPEPATASYLYQSPTYILVPPCIVQFAGQMSEKNTANFRLRFKPWPGQTESRNASGRGVITEIRIGKNAARGEQFYQDLVTPGIEINNGVVVRLSAPPPIVKSAAEFTDWLRNIDLERRDWMAFVFPEQTGNSSKERLTWLVIRSRNKKNVEPLRTFIIDENGRKARLPKLAALAEKKVVLIGCGSVGSKIGAALAATGVERFGLVDFDYMEPDNAVRHELGVESFGLAKVQALERRLIQLNPRVWGNVEMSDILIGGTNQAQKEAHLQQMLSSASIVIDTTGDHAVSRFLNDICAEFKVPQVYATVTNGAWAGEIVRVIPRKTACWLCWDDQYYDSSPPGEPSLEPGVFAPGCDHPTFTGATYEVGTVASLASSLAVDTLLMDEPDRKHFGGDYIRWQLKDNDGNFSPRVEVLPIGKRDRCRLCGEP